MTLVLLEICSSSLFLASHNFFVNVLQLECTFYERFARLPYELALPRFFYAHEYHVEKRDGLLVLEDLSVRATTVRM